MSGFFVSLFLAVIAICLAGKSANGSHVWSM